MAKRKEPKSVGARPGGGKPVGKRPQRPVGPSRVVVNCRHCKRFVGVGKKADVCPKCALEIEHCPVCGDGVSDEVCVACINANVPICEFCRRQPKDGSNLCEVCLAPPFAANNFRSEEFSGTGIPDNVGTINGMPANSPVMTRPEPVPFSGGPLNTPRMVAR